MTKRKKCICKRCRYEWMSRIESPARCPRCQSPSWDESKNEKSRRAV